MSLYSTDDELKQKVYVLLGRAAFRLRYEQWQQEREAFASSLPKSDIRPLHKLYGDTLPGMFKSAFRVKLKDSENGQSGSSPS